MGLSQHAQIKSITRLYSSESKLFPSSTSTNGSFKSILVPNGLGLGTTNEVPGWYNLWILSQLMKFPSHKFDIFHASHESCTVESHWDLLVRCSVCVAEAVTHNVSITIDEVVGRLLDEGLLAPDAPDENLDNARYFVFTILGYQTMLYCPSPLDGTPDQPHELCVIEDPGCCSYTHVSLTQDVKACAREPLSELLMGFGVLLPSKNLCLDDEPNIQHTFHEQVEVNANRFNAYALYYIAGIKIKWTDALACHMEFNATTKELSLFRFPSFCQFCLAQYRQGEGRGVLHGFATTSSLRCQWATEEEINELLLEVLLSYRLLFAETKKSRALFRSIDPFLHGDKHNRKMKDSLLSELCGRRSWHTLLLDLQDDWQLAEKDTYSLPHDFPILRYRIIILQKFLSTTTARTWRQLWRDNRDSANWLTFWAVIIFGAFGSLMTLLQVILQFVQLLTQS